MKKRIIGALSTITAAAAITAVSPAGAAHAANSCGYASTVGGALSTITAAGAITAVSPAGAAHAANSCGYASTVGYTCYYYYNNDTISEWSGNTAAVEEIQDIINVHTDYPTWLTVDGSFGPNTLAAVEWLQSHHHIAGGADGIVGPNTWAFLRS